MASGIKAGKAYVELGLGDKMSKGLRAAGTRLKAFGNQAAAIGRQAMMAGALVLAPIIAASKVFASVGDTIGKMARRTGLSTEALSELSFAAERSGTDMAALEKGVRKMQQTIFDAERELSTAVDGLDALGLAVEDLKGLKPEDQFTLLLDAISKIEDPSRRAAVSLMIFGKAGTAMIPMLENGAKGIADLRQKARDLGLTISQEDALAAENFTDVLGDMWSVLKHGVFLVGASLVPVLQDAAKYVTETATAVSGWIDKNRELIEQYGKLIAKTAAWVIGLGVLTLALGTASTAIGGLLGMTAAMLVPMKGMIALLPAIASGLRALPALIFAADMATKGWVSTLGLILGPIAIAAAAIYAIAKAVDWYAGRIERAGEEASEANRKFIVSKFYSGAGRDKTGKMITPAALPGEAAAPGQASPLSDEALRMQESWIKRLHNLRISQIADEIEQINARYADEIQKAEDAGAEIANIVKTRDLEIAAAKERIDEEQRQRDKKVAEAKEALDEQIADANEDRVFRVAELELRTKYKGLELEKKRINLRREQALEDAKSAGQRLDLVEREHDLQLQLADMGRDLAGRIGTAVSSTFSATVAGMVGFGPKTALDRIAKATEQTATNTGREQRRVRPLKVI